MNGRRWKRGYKPPESCPLCKSSLTFARMPYPGHFGCYDCHGTWTDYTMTWTFSEAIEAAEAAKEGQ